MGKLFDRLVWQPVKLDKQIDFLSSPVRAKWLCMCEIKRKGENVYYIYTPLQCQSCTLDIYI